MKLLVTSDSQAEFSNLDLLTQSFQEILTEAKTYKPDVLIHAGDLKEHYNPCDLRVVKWWVRTIKQVRDADIRFIVMLGNHDRISQSHESKNWLDILQAAGAEIVTTPRWKQVGDEALAFLPYTADKKQEKEWADKLVETRPANMATALIFHTEIGGARMGQIKSKGISLEELQTDKYSVCLGGHLHEHQKFKGTNVYYIGSPFCHDWGEANQRKGFLKVTLKGTFLKVDQVPTSIPGWYTLDYLETEGIQPEKGSFIRHRVTTASKKVVDQLRAEEQRLEKLYPDCKLLVTPVIDNTDKDDFKLSTTSDHKAIWEYVSKVLPDNSRINSRALIQYLSSKLEKVNTSSLSSRLKWKRLRGHNVLPFKDIDLPLDKLGLVVLNGKNLDWHNKSNGSGKSSVLNLLPIACYGQTLKKQVANKWKNERTKGPAWVELTAYNGKNIKIVRRRPHGLQLIVNGKDISSGLIGTRKNETQGLIEKELGYDLDMLKNAIYIDQTVANGFVFGSQSDRLELVKKILRLDRFEDGRKKIAIDIKKNEIAIIDVENTIANTESDIERIQEDIQERSRQEKHDWESLASKERKELNVALKTLTALKAHEQFYVGVVSEIREWIVAIDETAVKLEVAQRERYHIERERIRIQSLVNKGKCPTCGQITLKLQSTVPKAVDESNEHKLRLTLKRQSDTKNKLSNKLDEFESQLQEAVNHVQAIRSKLETYEHGEKEERSRNEKIQDDLDELKKELSLKQRVLKASRTQYTNLSIDKELLEFSNRAFSRQGMPLYLAQSLIPILNSAAQEYAELFFEGQQQIRFEVQDGEFIVSVLNSSGSQTIKGQSVGESAMAGIICAFSLREVSPKTNLLVLDEPGAGLDAEGAKQFARGLLKLKEKFSTIILTTHSSTIQSVLSGEQQWTVTKRKGISKLSVSDHSY